jgi:hypothetical protein
MSRKIIRMMTVIMSAMTVAMVRMMMGGIRV